MSEGFIRLAPDVPMTDEQVAEFGKRFAEAMENGRDHVVILPAGIDCIICSGPDLIHAEGCPLAPPEPGDG